MGEFAPLSASLGGVVAQEAIKGLTNKFMPIQQLCYIDCCEVLDEQLQQDTNTRSLSRFLGQNLSEKIEKSKIFMVGCGAIGCELLKNFAMLNLGIQGSITITDPDHIEVSNLNRQFLFREKHLRKPKSQTAAAAIIQMNPYLKNHIIARLDKVHDQTEHIYTDQFFEELDIVANALDNVAARRYVDSRCVNAHTPLLESGTLGPKGHVQCIIPFQTESYGSSNDPVEEGDIPYCTLKMFPEETFHCVEFARDKFGKLFSARPKQLIKMMTEDYIPTLEDNKPLREGIKLIKNQPQSFSDCVKWARNKFQKYFFNDIKQLMYTYPEDAKTKEGNLFWTLPKRPPKPIIFDPSNELHQQFVTTFAYLRAKLYGLQTNNEWRSKEFRQIIANEAAQIQFSEWQPSEEKKKQISDKVKEEGQKDNEEGESQSQTTQQETQSLFQQFKSLLPIKLIADEFEKDNDQNGHIDFIHSFGNLRAANYKLEPMDWLTVKIKAGRIVPALATTTAVVAGLQTIELIKTLKNVKLSQMKNAFVNLAIPFIQLTEPGVVPQKKINDKVTVTLWDRWTQQITKNTTLGQLFEKLHQEYDLHPINLFVKAQPVYMEIMYAKKPEEKKHILDQPLVKLLDIQKYLDLTINFTLNANSNEIIKGIPTVRVVLS